MLACLGGGGRQGNEGWDIYRALADIRKQATERGEASWLDALDFLEARVTEVQGAPKCCAPPESGSSCR